MKIRSLVLAASMIGALGASAPLFAHHGGAAYDQNNQVTVTGTVTAFEFVNPHCQIYFEVKNAKGETEAWQGEITAPTKLARAGWTKHTLKPGDTVTITGAQARSGKLSLAIRKLIGPTGEALPLFED